MGNKEIHEISANVKLTIGMPVYNDIDFIEGSLNSILELQDRDFILLISDDNSNDGSGEICKRFAEKDKRVVYIKQSVNLGISKNMKLLLDMAQSPYFMWAGDDDLWHPRFTTELIRLLEENKAAVSSFCIYQEIDDHGENYFPYLTIGNYHNPDKVQRLKYFIKNALDGFGYGIFRTDLIKEVEFPVWWWPNKKSPLNNIYPTLCYYLAQGDFVYYEKEVLYWKRKKTRAKTNYTSTGEGKSIKALIAYFIRKFNLIVCSFQSVKKSSGLSVATKLILPLCTEWFMKPCLQQVVILVKAILRRLKK
jgi:glycosyltransferase involved in cell wall biosynthesis